jgi:hypothetical protein
MVAIWIGFIQNFLSILMTRWSFSLATGVLVVKDVCLYIVSAAVCLAYVVGGRLPRRSVVLCIVAIFGLLLAGALSSSVNVLSLRQLLIVPLYFLYGRWFVSKASVLTIERLLLMTFGLLVVTGYVERFLLFDGRELFWSSTGIRQYMEMKGFEDWAFGEGGVPGNFYSYDLLEITGRSFRRMVSILAEPTLFGQLLVFPVLYAVIRKKWMSIVVFGIALLLTMSKGGIIGAVCGFSWYYWSEKKNKLVKTLLLVSTALMLGSFGYLLASGSGGSLLIHFSGLAANLTQLMAHPFGTGIGSAGNFAVLARGGDDAGAGESYLGALVGELGLIGLAAYAWLIYAVHRLRVDSNDAFLLTVKYACLATLVTGVASESAISYVGTGFIFALLPFVIAESHKLSANVADPKALAA